MKKSVIYAIVFLLFSCCFSFNVVAPDISIVSDSVLIDSVDDYKALGFDISKIDDIVLYEKECLVEGHMPLVFKFNNNDNVAVSEKNSFLSSSSVSSKGFSDISYVYRILRDYIYTYEVPVYDTKKVCYDVFDNRTGRNITSCFNESFISSYKKVSEVRYHWVDIKSLDSLVISKQGFVVVDIVGRWKANTVGKSVDIIPSVTINGMTSSFPKYAWWNSNWDYKKSITFNHNQVPSTLTNFPVLVNLSSDANLASYAQNDGDDICFTNSDESVKLNHEIELFDGATGRLVCWVNITSLNSVSDTVIYMYYGNNLCSSQEDVTGTWNTGYMAVWHLNDTSWKDSTVNNIDLVAGSAPAILDGKIGYGANFTTDDLTHATFLDSAQSSLTIEYYFMLISADSNAEYHHVSKQNVGSTYGTYFFMGSRYYDTQYNLKFDGETEDLKTTSDFIATRRFYYAGFTLIGGSSCFKWLDGRILGNNACAKTWTAGTITDFNIGGYTPKISGMIDEVRVSRSPRSVDWVRTSYNCVNNATNGSFFVVGSQEEGLTEINYPPTFRSLNIVNGSTNCICCFDFCINSLYDNDSSLLNITISSNFTGVWTDLAFYNNISNNTEQVCFAICDFDVYDFSFYYFNVSLDDGVNSVNYPYYFKSDTLNNCSSIKESDIMDVTMNLDSTLVFLIVLMTGWLFFTSLYFKRKQIILGLVQFMFAMPLSFVIGSIAILYPMGYAVTIIIPLLSIVILADAFYGRVKPR